MAKKITQIEINGETYNVGGSGESVSGNFINQVDDFSQYVPTKWNEIAQYVGTDTPLYKNGYFYKNSGSWIIPVDTPQIAYQSITESGEHAIPIVSPLYEGLSSPVFIGSNAYYGMLSGNTPTVGGKIFDFLTGTINTITAVTDNGDETYICVTDGGAREETTTYTLDMTEEFDYTERVDAYKNRFIVIEYADISDYPSSMFGFYIVEETDPNTGTLVKNYYPAGLNGCVVTRTTAPVVIDRGTWTQIDVQPTSSAGSGVLIGYFADQRVSIVPYVSCIYENGKLFDPWNHEEIPPEEGTYYYDINGYIMLTLDENDELFDVTNSVLVTPEDNQIVIDRSDTLYSPNAREYIYRYDSVSRGYHPISDRLAVEDYPQFSEFQTRENLKGDGTEPVLTLWGKIKKWFSDLKDLAFIGKPSSNQTTTFLRGDGTWQEPPNTTYSLSATNENVTLTPSQGSASNVSLNTLINGLSVGTSDPADNDYIIAQYVNGGTTTTTYHRRPLSKFWNWIRSKLGIGTNDGTFLRKDGTWATPSGTTYSAGQGLVKNGSTFKIGSGTNVHLSKQAAKSGDYILITINDYNAWMLSFKVRFYGDYKCDEYIISGYNYGSSYWYSPSVVLISSSGENRDVKFGYTAQTHLWVAIPNANYYGVDVLDVVCGYQQVNSYDGLFTLTETSSLSGTTQTTITVSPLAKKSDIPSITGKVNKSGDSMSGTLTFTTANAINYNANNGNISMIRFKTGDADGHGIIIGGGGLTVIGAGESATTVAAQTSSGGSETMQVASDGNIEFYTNCQSGFSSAKKSYFDTSGDLHVNRYVFASHLNQSSGNESSNATSSSYIMFCNSDGYLRKATVAQIKSLVDTNTWRPLGTGASDACAGNDSRLSNSRPASDVYAWAKASNKPSYTASEVGAMSSAAESKTSTTWYNSNSGTFNCYKIGRIVIGYIGISSRTIQIAANTNVCLLPYTPSQSIYFPVQNADSNNGLLGISSGSTILKTVTNLAAGTSFYGMFCYVATS